MTGPARDARQDDDFPSQLPPGHVTTSRKAKHTWRYVNPVWTDRKKLKRIKEPPPPFQEVSHLDGNESLVSLAESISQNATVRSMGLEVTGAGLEDCAALDDVLLHHAGSGPAVELGIVLDAGVQLDLGGHSFGPDGAWDLADALAANTTARHVALRHNALGEEGGWALGNMLRQNTAIEVLDVGYNDVAPPGFTALGNGLRANGVLEHLHLPYNEAWDEGAIGFADGLAENQSLQVLDLCANHIGDAGAAALARALGSCQLRTLDLGSNGIGDEGAAALAGVLAEGCPLTSLNLGQNTRIGEGGAQALFQALEQNRSLIALGLRGCGLGDADLHALADALRQNRTLLSVDLGDNTFSPAAIDVLAQAMKENLTLQHFNVGLLGPEADWPDGDDPELVQAWRLRKWWERRGEDETLRQLVERMIHHEVGTEIYGEDVTPQEERWGGPFDYYSARWPGAFPPHEKSRPEHAGPQEWHGCTCEHTPGGRPRPGHQPRPLYSQGVVVFRPPPQPGGGHVHPHKHAGEGQRQAAYSRVGLDLKSEPWPISKCHEVFARRGWELPEPKGNAEPRRSNGGGYSRRIRFASGI